MSAGNKRFPMSDNFFTLSKAVSNTKNNGIDPVRKVAFLAELEKALKELQADTQIWDPAQEVDH
jgi:hypothetical protein